MSLIHDTRACIKLYPNSNQSSLGLTIFTISSYSRVYYAEFLFVFTLSAVKQFPLFFSIETIELLLYPSFQCFFSLFHSCIECKVVGGCSLTILSSLCGPSITGPKEKKWKIFSCVVFHLNLTRKWSIDKGDGAVSSGGKKQVPLCLCWLVKNKND